MTETTLEEISDCEFYVVFDTDDKNYFDGDPYIRWNTINEATKYFDIKSAKEDMFSYDGIGKEYLVIQKITIKTMEE